MKPRRQPIKHLFCGDCIATVGLVDALVQRSALLSGQPFVFRICKSHIVQLRDKLAPLARAERPKQFELCALVSWSCCEDTIVMRTGQQAANFGNTLIWSNVNIVQR